MAVQIMLRVCVLVCEYCGALLVSQKKNEILVEANDAKHAVCSTGTAAAVVVAFVCADRLCTVSANPRHTPEAHT
jgi:hypothetical protein